MFHSLRVTDIVEETRDARSLVLDVPASLGDAFAYRAGQFLTIRVECDGEPLQRCYSLSSAPSVDRHHKVTVKRVRGGRVSNWLNDHLRVGDELAVMRPEGRFVLDAADAPLLLMAGGSGITPVISILKTALATTTRRVTLLYANRDEVSVIFRGQIEALRERHSDRLRVLHRLDTVHGQIDERIVGGIASEARDASCYVCGPGPFMALAERAAIAAGLAAERIRIERFTVDRAETRTPMGAVHGAEAPDEVDVELRGERRRIPYVAGKTLLQVARDGGFDAPYSCEEGFCGSCAAHLTEGRVVMDADDALTPDEKRRGMILACQSRPLTRRCAFRFAD
jgi:3-ketosteroid 9alpha-monooxygenase subunit B